MELWRTRPGGREACLPGRSLLLWAAAAFGLAVWLFLASGVPALADGSTCANCHGDKARLESLSKNGKKVYVDPAKYAAEFHARYDCTVCHGGDPTVDSPEACVGVAMKNPSAPENVDKTCGTCHTDITKRHKTSMHATANGIRLSLESLLGTEAGKAEFDGGCNKCHATCASCHMEDVDRRGIFWSRTESHSFTRSAPNEVCAACHGAMGDTFMGEPKNPEHGPSVMATAGVKCTDCHGEKSMHGDGSTPKYNSETKQPVCEECHGEVTRSVPINGGTVAPQYNAESAVHKEHAEGLSCATCHTQWAPSCWNCHQGREEKSSYALFMLQDKATGVIKPAVHSPIGTEWGGVSPEGGGWVIKERHSWGPSRTCEACHTTADPYIDGSGRQGIFVSGWGQPAPADADEAGGCHIGDAFEPGEGTPSATGATTSTLSVSTVISATAGQVLPQRARAAYIDPKLVERVVLDMDAFKKDVHKDTECQDCHATLDDQVCADCHARSPKTGNTVLAADADWSRTSYMTVRDSLRRADESLKKGEAAGKDVSAQRSRWGELKDAYLAASNTFHGNPGPAQQTMAELAPRAQELASSVEHFGAEARPGNGLLVGLPLAAGLVGTAVLGVVYFRPTKKQGERSR